MRARCKCVSILKSAFKRNAKRHWSGQEEVWVRLRAPRDPAAWTRPCLLCTSCTCFLSDCAGRCCPLRTPCTCSFADCAHIALASALVLASPPRCFLPRLRLAPPASCCLLHSAPPRPCCCLHHPSAPTGLPRLLHRFFPRSFAPCPPLLDHCPRAPCPCRYQQPFRLPHSWPHRRPHPPGRRLPTQAPCPCRCCH